MNNGVSPNIILLDMSYSTSTHKKSDIKSKIGADIEGEVIDIIGDRAAQLEWSTGEGDTVIIRGASDMAFLDNVKGALLKLKQEFFSGNEKIIITGDKKEQLDRRMLLLEHEIDGILKRKINYTGKDIQGGTRSMDYTGILNEKENQIVELEKKINNLEERLRRASQREADLENEIVRLNNVIKTVNNSTVTRKDIDGLLIGAKETLQIQERFEQLKAQFISTASLIQTEFATLRGKGISFQNESALTRLLADAGVKTSIVNGVLNVTEFQEKIIEVPVQESRTKHLIHMLATQMKAYFDKYPKLRDECDTRLYEFFQQELIDVIEVDELDRVV